MKKLVAITVLSLSWFGIAAADPVLNEATIESIRAEFSLAVENADTAPFAKYLHPGSKIFVDLDPSPSAGEMEVGYEDYMGMLAMALPMMQDAELYEEVLSISIDEENNQATLREKTIATMDMMGMKIRDESISETTFGVVDGEIKVLVARDQLVSTGPIE